MAKHLTDKKKKEIIAYFVECQNYSETGRKFNLNESTIRSVVKNKKNDMEEFTKRCEQKNKENTEGDLDKDGFNYFSNDDKKCKSK